MIRLNRYARVICVLSLLWATTSIAGDGVLEINQTCALNGGCFTGDGAGFPVSIDGTTGKSYQLTGDLDLTSFPTSTAIEITSSFVSLNLSGFEIAGVTDCSGTLGIDFACSPTDAGANGISLSSGLIGVTLRNGTLRGMPGSGILGNDAIMTRVEGITVTKSGFSGMSLGDRSQIVHSRVYETGLSGIFTGKNSMVSHCIVSRTGNDGIKGAEDVVVENSTSLSTTSSGFDLGPRSKFRANTSGDNFGENQCGGGICTERRRYYLTQSFHSGNETLQACTAGFYMASAWEILDSSNLQYDTQLGFRHADSGQGPSTRGGWIRTGSVSSSSISPGSGNCLTWTSDSLDHRGSRLALESDWGIPLGERDFEQWIAFTQSCNSDAQVWCIED